VELLLAIGAVALNAPLHLFVQPLPKTCLILGTSTQLTNHYSVTLIFAQ
jgi:hypothetical protein